MSAEQYYVSAKWRFVSALPLSLVISIALFLLMAYMVDNGQTAKQNSAEAVHFSMFMVEKQQATQRRVRTVPVQPKAPAMKPQATSQITTKKITASLQAPQMNDIGLNNIVADINVAGLDFSHFSENQQAMPLYRVEPRYPQKAFKQGAEGFVILSFTIDKTGRPVDIQVKSAKPRRMFEKSAIKALKKWKYQAKLVGGIAVAQAGQTVKLVFEIKK
ncbi:MAG: energy transducer TonB [Psychromonas sp.]|nr:energy transducer TonB [Alteromonadales bacterium]MCP5078003.1 energy transducer TonB [Psychromonas sp.]